MTYQHFQLISEELFHLSVNLGVEPNGLLWSMRAVGAKGYSERLRIKDVAAPFVTHFSVVDGHVMVTEIPDDGNMAVLCTQTLERTYQAEHVIRKPIRIGRIRGMMFIPHSEEIYILKQTI